MANEIKRLGYDFFDNHAVEVAKNLIGKTLVFGNFEGVIIETEAYRGNDDEASHAHKGPTPRSQIMFGKPGFSYVYLIYGMYNCLNVVTEKEGSASAVLIRGLKSLTFAKHELNGPGKLCRNLGITRQHNSIDVTTSKSLYFIDNSIKLDYIMTPRIGIKKATNKLWRFCVE